MMRIVPAHKVLAGPVKAAIPLQPTSVQNTRRAWPARVKHQRCGVEQDALHDRGLRRVSSRC